MARAADIETAAKFSYERRLEFGRGTSREAAARPLRPGEPFLTEKSKLTVARQELHFFWQICQHHAAHRNAAIIRSQKTILG